MKRPIVTNILFTINILVFIAMTVTAGNTDFTVRFLVDWGANIAPLTLGDEPWRLLTAMFLHIGVLHIFGNMMCLRYWGELTEEALGHFWFLVLYMLSGLAASYASASIHPGIVSVGASGAIAGVFGFMCVMWLHADPRITASTILVNFALNAAISFGAQVDWVAHVAGLVAGVFLGIGLYSPAKEPGPSPA